MRGGNLAGVLQFRWGKRELKTCVAVIASAFSVPWQMNLVLLCCAVLVGERSILLYSVGSGIRLCALVLRFACIGAGWG